ncbi:hypothetical protein BS614_04100 [Paenibacillus xylanexedens]|uniref:hypothetical protein n=1 Tax=Paenibacillus xylanexedens TaxID=528191 RepID=UPI0009387E97|nr:hypothetical protein [Paenibacillus xylanexedens]APO43314.1 hypothetical protein BS614_04100 [Paenibacillus xylanexedens]
MIKNFAKFSATMGKGFKVGESDVEIKLTLPLKVVQDNFMFLSTNQGEKINVFLGDPQAAFEFEEDERDAMYRTWDSGRRVTTDASGVVTQIEKPGSEPEQDENQAQLFGPAEPPIDQEQLTGDGQETGEGDDQPTVPPTGADDPSSDSDDPYGDNENNDIPDWMKDGGYDQSGSREMDFSSEESQGDQQPSADQDPPAGNAEGGSGDVDPDELERYILENRPIIPEITLDIPAAIERKRGSDVTWREIAADLGMSQGKLSGMLSRYKKAVKEQMVGSGVA